MRSLSMVARQAEAVLHKSGRVWMKCVRLSHPSDRAVSNNLTISDTVAGFRGPAVVVLAFGRNSDRFRDSSNGFFICRLVPAFRAVGRT
jgi:hypothetical protein